MKRKLFRGLLCLISLILFGYDAISSNRIVDLTENEPGHSVLGRFELASISFLGYFDNFGMFAESECYAELCRMYPQLALKQRFDVETGGEETYLLIPKDRSATVAINEYTFDMFMSGDESNARVLYRSEESNLLLIHCNRSDAMSDVHAFITSGKQTVDFQPHLDLNGGGVAPMNGVKVTAPLGSLSFDEKHLPLSPMNGAQSGIDVMLKNGRVSIFYDEQAVNEWIPKGVCAMSGWVGLKGLNGIAKDIFLADMGKEPNPMLAILMNDGSVRLFSIFGSLMGDPNNQYMSAALPNVKNIVSFTTESNDREKHADNSLFAIDNKGSRFELRPFVPCGSIDQYLKGAQAKEVTVSFDQSGNIQLQIYDNKDVMTLRQGTFFSQLVSQKNGISSYQVVYHCTRLLKENQYEYSVLDGELNLQVGPGNRVLLIPTKGDSLGVGLGKSIVSNLVR